jgi:hypothetical protein
MIVYLMHKYKVLIRLATWGLVMMSIMYICVACGGTSVPPQGSQEEMRTTTEPDQTASDSALGAITDSTIDNKYVRVEIRSGDNNEHLRVETHSAIDNRCLIVTTYSAIYDETNRKHSINVQAWNFLGIEDGDLELGGIRLSIPEDEFLAQIYEEPAAIDTHEEPGYSYSSKTYTFSDGLIARFSSWNVGDDFRLGNMTTTSPKYETARGLKVSDTEERMIELYGEPRYVNGDVREYADSGGEYIYHYITIENGIVTKIDVFLPA